VVYIFINLLIYLLGTPKVPRNGRGSVEQVQAWVGSGSKAIGDLQKVALRCAGERGHETPLPVQGDAEFLPAATPNLSLRARTDAHSVRYNGRVIWWNNCSCSFDFVSDF